MLSSKEIIEELALCVKREQEKPGIIHELDLLSVGVWRFAAMPHTEKWVEMWLTANPEMTQQDAKFYFGVFTFPACSALGWLLFLDTQDPEYYHWQIVRYALEEAGIDQEEDKVNALARELLKHIKELRSFLGIEQAALEDLIRLKAEGDMLWLDARFVAYLERINALEEADLVRNKSKELWVNFFSTLKTKGVGEEEIRPLWRLWRSDELTSPKIPPLRALVILARALWNVVVYPQLKRSKNYLAPALPLATWRASKEALLVKSRSLVSVGKGYEIATPAGNTVAKIEAEKLEEMARRYKVPTFEPHVVEAMLERTRTLTGQRLFRHITARGYQQMLIERKPDFRTITYIGGLRRLAEELGLQSKNDQLPDILDALELIRLVFSDGSHDWLLKWKRTEEAPNRKAEVKITLGDPLLPGYMFDLPKKTRLEREGARLAPLPSLFPPFVGSAQFHASQAVLQIALMEEFSIRAAELVEEGTIQIEERRWCELAEKSEVLPRLLPDIRTAWTQGQESIPAFLSVKKGERYTLAKGYAQELAFILETGEKSIGSSKRAQARKAEKDKKIRKTRSTKG